MTAIALAALVIFCLFLGLIWVALYRRNVHIWIKSYLIRLGHIRGIRRDVRGTKHVIFCFADHFEPYRAKASDDEAMARTLRWINDYEAMARCHKDADGRPPIHTFFYPEEEYNFAILDVLASHCQRGYGEVEIHLHHDNDTSEGLRFKLNGFVKTLHEKHGLLPIQDGKPCYAFVHGNWALDNSRKDGRWCGVNDELIVLRETGCYADFTLPSAGSDAQTSTINSIYYAKDDPAKPKSHDTGIPVCVNGQPSGDLMIIQGALALHWAHRKFGFLPRIEDSDIAVANIPIEPRIDLWVDQHIHVVGRPEWLFIKLSTHGCFQEFADSMFGGELDRMFNYLETKYNDGDEYSLHYTSARETYNIVKAAEAGMSGNPNEQRNFSLLPPNYQPVSDRD